MNNISPSVPRFHRFCNFFLKLVESERRIVCVSLLVSTKNEPQADVKESLQEVAQKIQSIVSVPNALAYINYDLNHPVDLKKGICYGMVAVFIRDFHQNCSDGLPFQKAAIKAAKSFADGGDLLACSIQHAHMISSPKKEDLDAGFSGNNRKKEWLSFLSRSLQGYPLLGLTQKKTDVEEKPTKKTFQDLEDGAYDVSTGTRVTNGIIHRVDGHATALLVHQKSFLLFDPNMGLFLLSDPHRYYTLRWHDDEVLVCMHIEPIKAPSLQEPDSN